MSDPNSNYAQGVCDAWNANQRIGKPTYKIIRFRQDGENEVIETGLALEDVQAHCKREDTHGDGWFDGYEEES